MKAIARWVLPLACAVIPAVAVHVAWWLSVRDGHIPSCIPYFEGCVSISRAARHGSGNTVFKLLMVPCAALQTMLWWSSARWIRGAHREPRAGRSLYALGLVAGFALAVYASFLGTDGAIYGWMRRFGITFYFGASFLAILVFLHRLRELGTQRGVAGAMLAVCALMLALGIASTAVTALAGDPVLRNQLENAMEWNLGILLTAWFLLHAALWKQS